MSKLFVAGLLLISLMFNIACNRQLTGQEAKAYILNPEHQLSKTVQLRAKTYRLNYWPEALEPGVGDDDLLYFELTSEDGKDLFSFSEVDFQIKTGGTYIPAIIVLPENFGSTQNHVLIGFHDPTAQEHIEIQIGGSSSHQLVRFSKSNIRSINKRIQKS